MEDQLKELTSRLETEAASEADLQRLDYLQNRLEWLGGYDYEQKTKRIVYGLGFTDEDLDKPANAFSGGQKTRINLAKALVRRPDFLFLDEPTNHLDEDSIDWLESYLSARQGGLLISTHDRYFLDSVCNGILELSNRRMYQYDGNYEEFIALKADREAREAATEEKRRQFLKREIEWVRRGALARTTKQKARLDRYEKLKNMEKTRRPDQMDSIALKRV